MPATRRTLIAIYFSAILNALTLLKKKKRNPNFLRGDSRGEKRDRGLSSYTLKKEILCCFLPLSPLIKNMSKKKVYLEVKEFGEVKKLLPNEIIKCPKCILGVLVKRNGIYGKFLSCNQFPKCRYSTKLK